MATSRKRVHRCLLVALTAITTTGTPYAQSDITPQDATAATRRANQSLDRKLAWQDQQDFEFAQRGFIGKADSTVIRDASGEIVWDMDRFAFEAIDAPAPDTVNPSLWRQARLNTLHGLFKVTDRVYQVRGYDLSNLSIIEGDTGYIVIDPLITREVAKAAMDLAFEYLPKKPVVAVIYSHSHADHFGGVKGVVDAQAVAEGKVRVIASEGFMKHAVSENVLAGNVMSRRASYMFGSLLPKNPRGNVGVGLGKTISSGQITLIEPTELILETGQELVVDGVRFVFMNTPGAEAPAELMFYLPDFKTFYAAEEANATLHNLYTLRGARVRDSLLWSAYLNDAIDMIGEDAAVLFGGHHWPRWGHDNIVDYLGKQRDAYKYIHDQTLRLANHGFTMDEIAESIALPDVLARSWFNRGYYGSVNHNVKAVYQLYLGWFDGNPANMHPLPPSQAASKYVEFMGGADAVLEKADEAFAENDYRWVVEVVNHVIFADPDNLAAKRLQANALEQLGYQAESGQWRNFYLTAASELRNGVAKLSTPRTLSPDMVSALTNDMIFDYLAVRLNGPDAAGKAISLMFDFEGSDQRHLVTVENSVLHHQTDTGEVVDATITLNRGGLIAMTLAGIPLAGLTATGAINIEGDTDSVRTFLSLLDNFEFWFNIVTP